MGGELGVRLGADYRNAEHNVVMYGEGESGPATDLPQIAPQHHGLRAVAPPIACRRCPWAREVRRRVWLDWDKWCSARRIRRRCGESSECFGAWGWKAKAKQQRRCNGWCLPAGCPWREDPTDCSTPGMEGRGDVNEHGLQYLLISFFDAIETVLARYAPGSDADFNMDFRTRSEVSASSEYTDIKGSAEKRALLASDPDVKFILSAFAGDVFNGLGMTLNLFHDETADVLASTHVETRLLFGIYFAIVALGFYRLLFRRTIRVALGEVEKTRSMVSRNQRQEKRCQRALCTRGAVAGVCLVPRRGIADCFICGLAFCRSCAVLRSRWAMALPGDGAAHARPEERRGALSAYLRASPSAALT
eukprot:1135306-Rhodomonas_salina.2